MVSSKYIPTRLVEKKNRKKVKIVDPLEARRVSTAYVIRKFTVYFLGIQLRRFTGKSDLQKTATQLRELFEDFGGFWVKAGQVLALRTDLFPEIICNELRSLQYEAVGFPAEIARSIIESELGKPVGKIFEVFDEQPLAAASIGQIHTAILREKSAPVVVKIQRPGLTEAFQRDLDVIKIFVKLLIYFDVLTFLRWDEFIVELEKIFREELDFRYEASSTTRMRKSLKEHDIYIPKIYEKYCQRRVLVMEYIDGVLMSDYIRTLKSDRSKLRRWEMENNFDRKKVGERLYLSLFRQIFEDNIYHGDLHPGNIILLRNSKFALIDLGSTGSFEKGIRTIYLNYIYAVAEGNFVKAADYFIRLGVDIPKVNIPKVRVEMARGLDNWADKAAIKSLSYGEKSLGVASKGVTDVAFGNGIPTNWSFLKLTRSFFALDGSLQYLIPELDVFEILRKYRKQAERRALINNLRPEGIIGSFTELKATINEYNSVVFPEIQKRTLPYKLTVNKFARALVVILQTLSFIVAIGEFSLVYAFFYQHYFKTIQLINIKPVDELFVQFPYIPYLGWILILIAGGLTLSVLLTCAEILNRKELEV